MPWAKNNTIMEFEKNNELLDRFYSEYHEHNYNEAITLLSAIIQKEKKGSFWLYSTMSACYYELKDYKKALFYAKKAYKLKPNSPLVLWDYASALIMLKKEKEGIELLMIIQDMDEDLTLYGFPVPNIGWMRSIKNDANFLIGKAYYTICEDELAKEFLLKHLSNRKRGRKSIYPKKIIIKYLKKLES
jgi:tetratricopeptide (TPR) repeat protein